MRTTDTTPHPNGNLSMASQAPVGPTAVSPLGPDFWVFVGYLVFVFLNPQNWIPVIGAFRPAFLVAGMALVLCLANGRAVGVLRFTQTKLMVLLLGLVSVSTVLSMSFGLSLEYWGYFLRAFLLYLLFLQVVHDEFKLKKIIQVMFFLMLIDVAVSFTMQKLWLIGYRLVSFDGEGGSNDYALMILCMLPFGLYFFEHAETRTRKGFLAVCILFLFMALTRTRSRMGFLGLVLIVGQVFWLKRRNPAVILAVLALVGVALANTHYGYFERIRGIQESATTEEKENPRIRLWQQAVELIKRHPFFGTGTGTYIFAKNEYNLSGNKTHVTHNAFLQVASENGLIAGAVYFLLFLVSFRDLRYAEKAFRGRDPDLLTITQALKMAYPVLVLSMTFLSQQYTQFYFIFPALTARLRLFAETRIHAEAAAETAEAPAGPGIHPTLADRAVRS
ncbi:MAG: O-antigen ligase family protein [Desulfobacterales bacterium]